jgi:AcrR family transcriptional regulator
MPTHAENRETRRHRLMAEARKLYASGGVENTPMEEVARASGCTRRTLYAYFSSWEDLVLQVYIADIEDRWRHQKQAMAKGKSGLQQLKFWAQAYHDFAVKHPGSVHLEMFRDYRGIDPLDQGHEAKHRYEEVVGPVVTEMVGVFCQGQKDGSIREDLAPLPTLNQFALSLRTLMNRVLSSGDSPEEFDTADFVSNYIDLFLRGIATHPEVRI